MNAPRSNSKPETAAAAAMTELMQSQAKALAELYELNVAMMRAWGAANDLQRLAAEYPKRISEICTRSASAWAGACAEQTRQWNEMAGKLASLAVSPRDRQAGP